MPEVAVATINFDVPECIITDVRGTVQGEDAHQGCEAILRLRGHGVDDEVTRGIMKPSPHDGSRLAFSESIAVSNICKSVDRDDRSFWCFYAVIECDTGTVVTPLVCYNCNEEEIDSTPHENVVTDSSADRCTCYCLKEWRNPLPNPDVVDSGYPQTDTDITTGGVIQTEIERGKVFWAATIQRVNYDCHTGRVQNVRESVVNLGRRRYEKTRQRTLKVSWPPLRIQWGRWSNWTRQESDLDASEAMATSNPPYQPLCSQVGIECP